MKRLLAGAVIIGPLLLYIIGWRSLSLGLRPGDQLPAAQLESLDGTVIETSSWRGTPTLLVLFQPACRSCREQIRALTQIAPKLHRLRIVLLSVSGEPPAEEVPFMVCRDAGGAFLARTRRHMVPALYWIDSSGRITYVRTGVRTPLSDLQIFARLLSTEGRTGGAAL